MIICKKICLGKNVVVLYLLSELFVPLQVQEGILVFVERSLDILVVLTQARLLVVYFGEVEASLSKEVIVIFINRLINHLEELDFFGKIYFV